VGQKHTSFDLLLSGKTRGPHVPPTVAAVAFITIVIIEATHATEELPIIIVIRAVSGWQHWSSNCACDAAVGSGLARTKSPTAH
jgi:hypothetical protein